MEPTGGGESWAVGTRLRKGGVKRQRVAGDRWKHKKTKQNNEQRDPGGARDRLSDICNQIWER